MLAALGLFLVIEVVGLLAAPLAALVLGRLPGAGLGFAKVLRAAARHVADLDGRVAAHRRLRRAADRRRARPARRSPARWPRCGCARSPDAWRRAAPSAACGGWRGSRCRPTTRSGGGCSGARRSSSRSVTRSARCWPSFAPDVWNTEKPMDMAFITAINASSHFPPHDPWMSGETLNYYYLGHMVFAWPIELLGLEPDAGYLLSWGLLLALTATAVYTFAGTLWAAARETLGERAPRGGPVARGPGGRGAGGDPRQPRRRALVDPGRRPAARLRLVRPVARDPGHDQRVPVVLVHPRRPARARARAAVHGARAGVRAAGRAARAARRPAVARGGGSAGGRRSRSGSLYAINSWSYPVAAGRAGGLGDHLACARRCGGAATRWSGSAWCWSRASR